MSLLQEYVDRQADVRPEKKALVYQGRELTYGEISALSNALSRLLKLSGCRRGDRIGILLPKSPEAVIGLLAALKADCIYVPIDAGSPMARIRLVLESSACRLLFAMPSTSRVLREILRDPFSSELRIGWLAPERPDIEVDFCWKDLYSVSAAPVNYTTDEQDPAHILFTSGSTGIPKGVMVSHHSVTCFVAWAIEYFQYSSEDRISGHPPLHFDLSTLDLFGTFASGAQLHLVPPHISLLPNKIADFIREAELTQWFSVPSLLTYMMKFDVVRQNDFPSLRRLLWCGESFPVPALRYWMQRLPHVSFTNLYGPTEAAIASSYYRVPAIPTEDEAIPIGSPCAGEELLVLDRDLNRVPPGEIGDLYIRGVGLSPGYWRDPEKTRACFVQNPSSSAPDLIYRTGDLASVGADGLFYLHGRRDSQIKSRGYRIELGEIEAALQRSTAVRECAVVAIPSDDFDGMTICCAVVPSAAATVDFQSIRAELATRVPAYMLPSRWTCVSSLPLNANGKIDRVKIKESFQRDAQEAKAASAVS